MTHDENRSFTECEPSEPPTLSRTAPDASLPPEMQRWSLPTLSGTPVSTEVAPPESLHDVELEVRIDWGHAYVRRVEAAGLEAGAIVPLDKQCDEPVDIHAAGRLIARGEVLELDEKYCVRVTELVSTTVEL